MAAAPRPRRLRVPFPIRLRWAGLRARLARHVPARRVALATAMLIWFVVVSDAATARRDAIRAWGATEAVAVARESAAVGATIATAEPELVLRPIALIAPDALRRLPDDDVVLSGPVRPGEVITARHLVAGGPPVPPGQRAIAVPLEQSGLNLGAGTAVDALLIGDPYGTDLAARAVPAIVLAVGDGSVTIGVSPDDALAVARTLASGRITLARR